jgi:hypothetical protein
MTEEQIKYALDALEALATMPHDRLAPSFPEHLENWWKAWGPTVKLSLQAAKPATVDIIPMGAGENAAAFENATVDVEELKLPRRHLQELDSRAARDADLRARHWNDCLDHLTASGYRIVKDGGMLMNQPTGGTGNEN